MYSLIKNILFYLLSLHLASSLSSLFTFTWYQELVNSFFIMPTSPSSVSATSSSSSHSSSSLHTFSTPLTLKLNGENFLIWCQQILAQVEGLDLLHFLTSSSTPPKHLTPDSGSVNPAYLLHKKARPSPCCLAACVDVHLHVNSDGWSLHCASYLG